MSLEELRSRLRQDGNLSEALVWREGFDDWKRAPEVEELYPPSPKPPPLPSVAPIVAPQIATATPVAPPEAETGWRKAFGIAASIGGGVIGLTLAKVLGSTFWLPAITVGASWFLFEKCKVPNWLLPMVAIVVGHTLWISIGIGILISMGRATEENYVSLVDIVIVAGLTLWVLKKQSQAACVGFIVYEVIAFGANLVTFSDRPSMVAAALMHIVLRSCGFAAAIYATVKARNAKEPLGEITKTTWQA